MRGLAALKEALKSGSPDPSGIKVTHAWRCRINPLNAMVAVNHGVGSLTAVTSDIKLQVNRRASSSHFYNPGYGASVGVINTIVIG
jgi:hypothetical protein